MAGGVIWLNRVATGGWRLWPLLGFLFLYNRILLWGFVNYLFGIGVALLGIASWLALEGGVGGSECLHRRSWHWRAFSVISPPSAFTRWRSSVSNSYRPSANCAPANGRRSAAGSLLAYRSSSHLRHSGLVSGTMRQLERSVTQRSGARPICCSACSIITIVHLMSSALLCSSPLSVWLLWTRRLGLAPRLAAAAGMVFAVYLLLPSQIYGGSGADHRLPIGLFLLLVAATAPRFPSPRVAAAVGVAAALVLVVRLGMIERVWRAADQVYSADLVGIDALPQGSKLAIAHPADLFHVVPIPEVHLAVLAISRREVFVPTLFAIEGQQPVALKPAFAGSPIQRSQSAYGQF